MLRPGACLAAGRKSSCGVKARASSTMPERQCITSGLGFTGSGMVLWAEVAVVRIPNTRIKPKILKTRMRFIIFLHFSHERTGFGIDRIRQPFQVRSHPGCPHLLLYAVYSSYRVSPFVDDVCLIAAILYYGKTNQNARVVRNLSAFYGIQGCFNTICTSPANNSQPHAMASSRSQFPIPPSRG